MKLKYQDLVWIRKPTGEEKKLMEAQPTWEHDAGVWPAHYDEREESFLVIHGGGSITTKEGRVYRFEVGDFVTCAEDFDCTWEVKDYIKKHYIFGLFKD